MRFACFALARSALLAFLPEPGAADGAGPLPPPVAGSSFSRTESELTDRSSPFFISVRKRTASLISAVSSFPSAFPAARTARSSCTVVGNCPSTSAATPMTMRSASASRAASPSGWRSEPIASDTPSRCASARMARRSSGPAAHSTRAAARRRLSTGCEGGPPMKTIALRPSSRSSSLRACFCHSFGPAPKSGSAFLSADPAARPASSNGTSKRSWHVSCGLSSTRKP
mmetsp:Transcript_39139/g.98366  ORF Transcript_39139/g.98366 Transcript_39139/m.98366 type:complete len:228 (-) Transcript_39139:171-854(-)